MQQSAESLRVLVLGVDAAGGPWTRQAPTPHLDALFAQGVVCYQAQTVLPSASYEAWGSMLTGVPPQVHQASPRRPFADDSPHRTWLSRLSEAWQQPNTGVFATWPAIVSDLLEPGLRATRVLGDGETIARLGAEYLRCRDPRLVFLYWGGVDDQGHAHGYDSPQCLEALREADRQAGTVLAALDQTGRADQTLVLAMSDHGGLGSSHGGDSPEEMTIFWAARGPGIPVGRELPGPVSIMDSAPLILTWAGLPLPAGMQGRVPPGLLAGWT